MRLFYVPGASSLAAHIALLEAGLACELVRVEMPSHRLPDGTSLFSIDSRGYVPLLELPDGQGLAETPAVLQFIADQSPGSGLAPAAGSLAAYRMLEWLAFINSELHKGIAPLFDQSAQDDVRRAAKAKLAQRLDWVASRLGQDKWLLGDQFTVADAYMFTILGWAAFLQLGLDPWPSLA